MFEREREREERERERETRERESERERRERERGRHCLRAVEQLRAVHLRQRRRRHRPLVHPPEQTYIDAYRLTAAGALRASEVKRGGVAAVHPPGQQAQREERLGAQRTGGADRDCSSTHLKSRANGKKHTCMHAGE